MGYYFTFQQDNASTHTSNETTEWLVSQPFDKMEWPPQSPDLNIIENVWGVMVHRLEQYSCTNEEEFRAALVKVWDSIDYTLIQSLYRSIPTRTNLVIEKNGLPTRY